MGHRLDEIDRRTIYRLTEDARNISAPDIADEMNVSAGTIRNRIRELEQNNIIKGYHAHIDYEQAEGLLTDLFMCNTSVNDREKLAKQVLQIPGVVNVREIMTGQQDLRVKAVGEGTEDLTRIANAIVELGIEIEDEELIKREYFQPYQPYGPEDVPTTGSMTDFMTLSGDAEVAEITVGETAQIAGKTLKDIKEKGLLKREMLVVTIERDGRVITPQGETTIEPGDIVTLLSPDGIDTDVLEIFEGASKEEV
jgi:DNA-binding Lrp family transcriptional regulator